MLGVCGQAHGHGCKLFKKWLQNAHNYQFHGCTCHSHHVGCLVQPSIAEYLGIILLVFSIRCIINELHLDTEAFSQHLCFRMY